MKVCGGVDGQVTQTHEAQDSIEMLSGVTLLEVYSHVHSDERATRR